MVRGDGTGCPGWSRHCDHAAAVPAVRRVLGAFSSVPRQSGGLSSRMQILVRTVHTVQQTVEISQLQFLMVVDAPVVLQRQVPWLGRTGNCGDSAVAVLGVLQFLDKVVVPAGATTVGRALLGSTLDTCYFPGRFFGKKYDFLREGVDSAPELDSRLAFLAGTSSTTAVACTFLVLLVSCTSRYVPTIAGGLQRSVQSILRLLAGCTWKSVHYFLRASWIFQHVQRSIFCTSRFFGTLEHSHL